MKFEKPFPELMSLEGKIYFDLVKDFSDNNQATMVIEKLSRSMRVIVETNGEMLPLSLLAAEKIPVSINFYATGVSMNLITNRGVIDVIMECCHMIIEPIYDGYRLIYDPELRKFYLTNKMTYISMPCSEEAVNEFLNRYPKPDPEFCYDLVINGDDE